MNVITSRDGYLPRYIYLYAFTLSGGIRQRHVYRHSLGGFRAYRAQVNITFVSDVHILPSVAVSAIAKTRGDSHG